MTLSIRFQLNRTLFLASVASLQVLVAGQTCYYPNGNVATDDAPCSSEEGAACCPLNWQCLDNGLCYLDNQKYFGRYTCTDKSWESSSCPGFCTNNKQDFGAQAVQQCANHSNQYCCDQNRDVNNVCCDREDDGSLFFDLQQGKPTATIARLGAPAAAATGSSSNTQDEPNNNNDNESDDNESSTSPDTPQQPSTTIPPTISASTRPDPPSSQNNNNNDNPNNANTPPTRFPTTPATSSTPATITSTSASTASSNGITSIILLTSIITSSPSSPPLPAQITAPPSSSSSTSSTNAAAIGGGVGGGIAALLLLSLITFLCLKRRKRTKVREHEEATVQHPPRAFLADQKVEGLEYMYKGQQDSGSTPATMMTTTTGEEVEGSPEIDGREVGVKKVAPVAGEFDRGGGSRPGEKTRVEGLGVGEMGGGGGEDSEKQVVPRDKWEAYEMAADGR